MLNQQKISHKGDLLGWDRGGTYFLSNQISVTEGGTSCYKLGPEIFHEINIIELPFRQIFIDKTGSNYQQNG